MHGQESIDSMDGLRGAIRKHWHRGATLLMEDWRLSEDNFDRFLETLIVRRAELPDHVPVQDKAGDKARQPQVPQDMSGLLVKALADIGVTADIRGFTHGPRITRYKVFLPDVNQHTKLQKGLQKLALVLNLQHTQPTLTKGDEARTVSLDIPRPANTWDLVPFEKLRGWAAAAKREEALTVFPGVDVLGKPYSFDLASAPHLLVGGTTGSGKSVCLHAVIVSLMLRFKPNDLQLALIDPKRVEFAVYAKSPYLYGDGVAFDAPTARERIIDLVAEMDARYQQFDTLGCTNIYEARKKGAAIPQIVVVIEEMADLVLADEDIENYIVRLAQKARAAGIYLVLATQRPDAETFSGLIRSNVPARIALAVQKSTESKIIIDETGAEHLLGQGDMLVKAKPGGQPDRVHGVWVSRDDVVSVLRDRK
jgi:S-DNA-T family DNA segregation ATPase FtsK/SpoIIIE